MNITCDLEKLKNAVILCEKMAGKNLTLPVLHNILLTASNKSLRIRSTNLTVGIEIEIPVTTTIEGSVLIKADVISNVCNNLPVTDKITIEALNENIVLKTNTTNTLIKCVPLEDFPTLPIVDGQHFTINPEILSKGIRSVYFCSAVTDIKPEIASIFIYSENNTICFVATDSFRLAEKKIKDKKVPEISKLLIPYKNITDILRVLDIFSSDIQVSFNKNQISFSNNGIYFTSRLIDGAFPDYQLILPKEEKTKIVLLKQEILHTLRLSTIFSDKFFQVNLLVSPKEKKIIIQSKNNDIGSSQSSIDAVIEGEPIEVNFNLKYFLDVFQSISDDSISISLTTANKPILVRGTQDQSFLYLLVPTHR